MKVSSALTTSLLAGLVTSAAIQRRQASLTVDSLEKDCKNAKGRNDQARTAMITYYQSPNFEEILTQDPSFTGTFAIDDPQNLAHSFDGDCNHISTVQMSPKGGGNGWEAKLDMGMGIIEITADCLGTSCNAKTGIESPNVSGVGRPADVQCHDGRTSFPDGFSLYGYRTCTIAYE